VPDADYCHLVIDRLSDRGVEGKLSFEPNFDSSRLLYRFSVPLLPKRMKKRRVLTQLPDLGLKIAGLEGGFKRAFRIARVGVVLSLVWPQPFVKSPPVLGGR
jgi:hypothetical protein